jgi:class 3 adenylate cyclase
VNFTVSQRIREISFHNPESLSPHDYAFKYYFSKEAHFQDGPYVVEIFPQVTKALAFIPAGAKQTFEFDAEECYLAGNDLAHNVRFTFDVHGEPRSDIQTLSIKYADGKFQPMNGALAPGRIKMEIENASDKRISLGVMAQPKDNPMVVVFDPFLSGKRLITTQTFRDIFRGETIQKNEGLGIKSITMVFTDLKGSTALYERIGDLKAFALVQQHFDRLEKAVRNHSGSVVKTIGDAIMATFLNPVDAMNAALAMLEEIAQFNQEQEDPDLILKIGIHSGASIVVTLNDKLDYFGQTVNIASRVQGLADASEVYFTNEVYSYPGVQELLGKFEISTDKARLKGIQDEVQVYKIACA